MDTITNYQPPEHILIKLQSDYNITESAITEFLKSFNNFDKNGDGAISISELGQVIKLITPHLKNKPTEIEVEEMIKAVDQNQDNMIQFEEFLALVARKKVLEDPSVNSCIQVNVGNNHTLNLPVDGKTLPTRSNSDSGISNNMSSIDDTTQNMNSLDLEQVFKIFDKNGDGFISKTEISDVMFELGEPVTEDDISNMTLGKEQLNFSQFKQVITNHIPFPEQTEKRESSSKIEKSSPSQPTSCSTCTIM